MSADPERGRGPRPIRLRVCEAVSRGEITCVEASAGMLARAQRRLSSSARGVRWHHGDLLAWEPDGPFDVIVTCFFLDCLPPDTLATVIARLANCAAPRAAWLVVDFSLPQRGPARWRAQFALFLMYAFFRRVVGLPARRLTRPDDLLRAHGYHLVARRDFDWGRLRADMWRYDPASLLRSHMG